MTRAAPACAATEQDLAGVWDGRAREAVHRAFVSTEAPYAEATWQTTRVTLDAYAGAWTTMRTDVCRATHVRHEQSEHMLDLREGCLDTRRRELGALVDVLTHADVGVIQKAVSAASSLTPLDRCARTVDLERVVPAPDPQERDALESLGELVTRAQALHQAGKYREGLALATDAEQRAQAVSYAPARARVWAVKGQLERRVGDFAGSTADLTRAVQEAERGSDDVVKAQALVSLVFVVGTDLANFAEAEHLGQFAQGALDRLGGDDVLQLRLEDALGALAQARGDSRAALEHYQDALQRVRRAFGSDHLLVGEAMLNLGAPLIAAGRHEEALALGQEAVPMIERAVGRDDPRIAQPMLIVGGELLYLRRYEEALRWVDRARAIPTAPKALVGYLYAARGLSLQGLGRLPEGRDELERALASFEATFGKEHPMVADACCDLAKASRLMGRNDEALRLSLRAVAILDRAAEPNPDKVVVALTRVGESYLAAAKPNLAVASLERAVRIDQGKTASPVVLAAARFVLAKALIESHGDGKRARSLADRAREAFAASPVYEDELHEVEAWLATR